MNQDKSIRQLQQRLRTIAACTGEIPSVIPDGVYGPKTEESVRAFQKAAGLPATGKVDEATWNAIRSTYNYCETEVRNPREIRIRLPNSGALQEGVRNAHNILAQAMLSAISSRYRDIPPVKATGIYDADTTAAVRALQKTGGLPQTGMINRHTWDYLVSTYRAATNDGKILN